MKMSSTELLEITDTNFDTLALQAPLPVLIDFTAAWCAPCRAIAPHVAAIARDYAGRLSVATCDADSNAELAARLDVRAMPTLIVFKAGQVVGQIVGACPRAKIDALVQRALTA
jgi:thioredoxin